MSSTPAATGTDTIAKSRTRAKVGDDAIAAATESARPSTSHAEVGRSGASLPRTPATTSNAKTTSPPESTPKRSHEGPSRPMDRTNRAATTAMPRPLATAKIAKVTPARP